MSQNNFLNLVTKNADPKILIPDIPWVEKQAAKRRAAMDKANPPKPVPEKVELNRLRSELFNLQQNATGCGIRVEQQAGEVDLLETQINEALKTKKQHEDAGNLLGARNYEHQVLRLEKELVRANRLLTERREHNTFAVRELLNWKKEFASRLGELTKEVG
jgi:hypothetical protein